MCKHVNTTQIQVFLQFEFGWCLRVYAVKVVKVIKGFREMMFQNGASGRRSMLKEDDAAKHRAIGKMRIQQQAIHIAKLTICCCKRGNHLCLSLGNLVEIGQCRCQNKKRPLFVKLLHMRKVFCTFEEEKRRMWG